MEREIVVDNEYGKLELEFYQGIPLLHLDIYQWSHNILKTKLLPIWCSFLREMKDGGHNVVLAVIPITAAKKQKLCYLFGMHEANRDNEHIIVRRWL